MTTLSLTRSGPRPTGSAEVRSDVAARSSTMLAAALLLILLYAAFSHGAASRATDARMQVALAAVATIVSAGLIWNGTLRVSAPRIAMLGIALLGAFAVWSGVSVLWSVAPDDTWIELNRALGYVIVLCLALVLGASARRSPELIAKGFVLVTLSVTAYALGQKLLPGLHIGGVFDLNRTGLIPRLQEPLGYWNALALFIAFGVPPALALAVDRTQSRRFRRVCLVGVELMVVTIGFSESRGGVIALVLALAIGVGLSAARLRSLMWFAAAALAAIPVLVFGLTSHSLTAANIALGHRERAGGLLLVVLLACTAALLAGARKLHELEQAASVGPKRTRGIGRLLAGMTAVVLVAAALAFALSSRGIGGSIAHAWNSFTTTRATSVYQPGRLLSAASENRWIWWKEAVGAFSNRPLTGWGAGSFPAVHLLYRRDNLSVSQPHSVPLQFLAETGVIGAVLALVGFALLLSAGTRTVRRLPAGRERLLAAALLAGAAGYAVHALYDWDWNIPGVTLPALVFLGVLLGAHTTPERDAGRAPTPNRPGPIGRALGLALVTLCMCTFALSAAVPSIAASKASDAVVAASSSSPTSVEHAQAEAELASRLDPLSDAGLLVESTIAVRRGEYRLARGYLLDAIKRDPTDIEAWRQLTPVELFLGDLDGELRASQRVLALDPHGQDSRAFAALIAKQVSFQQAPPKDSPTARPILAPAAKSK